MTEPGSEVDAVRPDERTWATASHLASFVGFLGVPFGNVLGPLVVWLVKRRDLPFVDDQGREALNFQISLTIYGLVIGVLLFLAVFATPESPAPLVVCLAAIAALVLFGVVATVAAAVQAGKGVAFRYPAALRLVR